MQDNYYQAIDQIKHNRKRYNNIDGIENKLTRFQIYPETELACKFKTPLYKEQYSQIFVKYEKHFDMKTGKLLNNPYPTYHNKNDKNSYIPVNFLKNSGKLVENFAHKTKAVHVYKNYSS